MNSLDDKTLQELAYLICGDDGPHYRSAQDLRQFFLNAGWESVPLYDGPSRRAWTLSRLREHRGTPGAIIAVVLRLCDSREYLGQSAKLASEVTRALNSFLIHEGYKIERPGGRPKVVECSAAPASATALAPTAFSATIADLVTDPELAKILQSRLDEAATNYENGCHVSAIIMLGSLVEGLLVDAVRTRITSPPDWQELKKWSLQRLISFAHRNEWIGNDATTYPCDALREYRNLVHPNAQMLMPGPPPDRDTVDLCWPVLQAVLNDLVHSAVSPNQP